MSKGPGLGERFWSKVEQDGDCWGWTSAETDGYSKFWINGGNQYAHRLSYLEMVGEIPEGLELDHLCRNRWCVNPYHADPVPQIVNRRRAAAAITACPTGHEYTPENTYIWRGRRSCRTCNRVQARESARRRRSAQRAKLSLV